MSKKENYLVERQESWLCSWLCLVTDLFLYKETWEKNWTSTTRKEFQNWLSSITAQLGCKRFFSEFFPLFSNSFLYESFQLSINKVSFHINFIHVYLCKDQREFFYCLFSPWRVADSLQIKIRKTHFAHLWTTQSKNQPMSDK